MSSQKIFITGTDTDVGKTLFTAALITALQNEQKRVVAFKPVAAGCELVDGLLKNSDALTLIDAMNIQLPYSTVNPIALTQAIAPHISAVEDGVELSIKTIQQACPLKSYQQNYILVEGAGGWLVPLNHSETFADYVKAENLDVILVVGLKLGCINHALLTQQSIKSSGLNLIGWVANHIDPNMLSQQQNIETLTAALNCPLIANIPYFEASAFASDNVITQAASYVRISPLNQSTPSC